MYIQKTHTFIHTYIHICTHMYTHTHFHIHTHTYVHTHTSTYTHIHTYTHTLPHTHTHTYIHTYIHTHKPSEVLFNLFSLFSVSRKEYFPLPEESSLPEPLLVWLVLPPPAPLSEEGRLVELASLLLKAPFPRLVEGGREVGKEAGKRREGERYSSK